MRIKPIGFNFMLPFLEGYAEIVEDDTADFILTMNIPGHEGILTTMAARQEANRLGIRLCFWTIEDPNGYGMFINEAKLADLIFTTDKAMIPHYEREVGRNKTWWLPLAANERMHRPLPLAEDATDLVFSGNWYDSQWEARRWGSSVVMLPLFDAGYTMTIYSYQPPPYPGMEKFYKGATGCYGVAEQYTHGRIVLGAINQRSGLDGRDKTYMTSMRTFEALACEKPYIAPWSDSYEALGFRNGEHMYWCKTPDETRKCAAWILDTNGGYERGAAMAQRGREFVLKYHTYGNRVNRIWRAICKLADPMEWR